MFDDRDRPPYVTFETRSIEDRDSALKQGKYVGRDVDFAIITPQGTKDRIEKIVSEWFENLKIAVRQERFNPVWLKAYEDAYKSWKESQEIPENGTPIINWPVLRPTQVKVILDANIRTIEDLAQATDSALAMIGMGAVALRQRARDYLAASEGPGKVAQEVSALREELKALQVRNETLESQVKILSTDLSEEGEEEGEEKGEEEEEGQEFSEELAATE